MVFSANQLIGRSGKNDDTGIVLRHPEHWLGSVIDRGVCREIATSSADGWSPSVWSCQRPVLTKPRSPDCSLRFCAAIPMQAPRRSCPRQVHSVPQTAIVMHLASSCFSLDINRLREGHDSEIRAALEVSMLATGDAAAASPASRFHLCAAVPDSRARSSIERAQDERHGPCATVPARMQDRCRRGFL